MTPVCLTWPPPARSFFLLGIGAVVLVGGDPAAPLAAGGAERAGVNDFTRFLRAEWDRVAGYGCLLAGASPSCSASPACGRRRRRRRDLLLVTGGIGAVFLLGVGATLLLSADLHDDFRKLHRVEEKLDAVYRVLAAEHPELIDLERPGRPAAGAGPEPAPPPSRARA